MKHTPRHCWNGHWKGAIAGQNNVWRSEFQDQVWRQGEKSHDREWKEENSWSVHQETEGKTTKLFWTILEKSGGGGGKEKKKAARKKRSYEQTNKTKTRKKEKRRRKKVEICNNIPCTTFWKTGQRKRNLTVGPAGKQCLGTTEHHVHRVWVSLRHSGRASQNYVHKQGTEWVKGGYSANYCLSSAQKYIREKEWGERDWEGDRQRGRDRQRHRMWEREDRGRETDTNTE